MDPQLYLQQATEVIVSWAPRIFGALAVLFFGRILAGWIRSVAKKAMRASQIDDMLIPFLSGMIYVFAIAIVAISAVNTLGVSTASFVAIFGAAGLAIALAFQGTFSNFSAGVMLLTFRPFNVGDFVEVGGQSGSVQSINIFSTILHTGDNIQIRIPNSNIFGNTIKNYSANDTRRIDFVVGVDYGDDLGQAVQKCQEIVTGHDKVLAEPAPVIAVHELGDSSVNLVVRPWVKSEDYWTTRWDLTRSLKEGLEGAGLSFPFPQRDVHLYQQSAN